MTPRRLRPALSLSLSLSLSGCGFELDPTLDGLRVTGGNLPAGRTVEWPVGQAVELWLSGPVDPATVHPGSVALAPWEAVGECRWTPRCDEGICARGTCWVEPLGSAELSALDEGTGTTSWPLEVEVFDGATGSRLRILPLRALPAHTPVDVVLGEGVRSPGGAPTVDAAGRQVRVRRTLVTADEGSSGPEARLFSPVPGEDAVPTNLVVVETSFVVPLPPDVAGELWLEAEEGPDVALLDPQPCPGWVPGSCVRWRVADHLAPAMRYRPGPGSVLDRSGHAALRPARQTWFRTGEGPDLEPPSPMSTSWGVEGPCLMFETWVQEAVRVELEGSGGVRARAEGAGWLRLGLPLSQLVAGPVSARLTDRAGAEVVLEHPFAGAPMPALSITEVLADPLGPEPSAEFIELVALEGTSTEGLWIADQAWSDIEGAVLGGEPVGDPLPTAWLEPGDLAIVVAASYPGSSEPGEPVDPAPDAATIRLEVDTSLGQGGLKNSGEVISLYRADPPQLLSSYDNWIEPESGISAVRPDPQACDAAAAWRVHPEGRSGPGRLP